MSRTKLVGEGTEGDPVREVFACWSQSGELLAMADQWLNDQPKEGQDDAR